MKLLCINVFIFGLIQFLGVIHLQLQTFNIRCVAYKIAFIQYTYVYYSWWVCLFICRKVKHTITLGKMHHRMFHTLFSGEKNSEKCGLFIFEEWEKRMQPEKENNKYQPLKTHTQIVNKWKVNMDFCNLHEEKIHKIVNGKTKRKQSSHTKSKCFQVQFWVVEISEKCPMILDRIMCLCNPAEWNWRGIST